MHTYGETCVNPRTSVSHIASFLFSNTRELTVVWVTYLCICTCQKVTNDCLPFDSLSFGVSMLSLLMERLNHVSCELLCHLSA